MLTTVFDMLQGFFLAPHVVSQAIWWGHLYWGAIGPSRDSTPAWDAPRTDLIQLVDLQDKAMITFAQAIQRFSPVDGFVARFSVYARL